MKLGSAHVENFRSAEDSGEFAIGPITCLVGKNEAGKSAILLAFAALNPHPATPAKFDKERDYPRRLLTQYSQRHPDGDAIAISTRWQLSDDERQKINEEIGDGVLTSSDITVYRRYDHSIEIEAEIDYKKAVDFLFTKFSLDASERSVIAKSTTTSELISNLKSLSSPTAKHKALSDYLNQKGNVKNQVNNIIKSFLPKFMYFAAYDRMDGAIQIEQVRSLIESQQINDDEHRGKRLFAEFLEYAGVSINDLSSVSTYETFNAKLQAASNNITDQVLEYWTQNPDLSVLVRVEQARSGDPAPYNAGTIARARIENSLHRVDTPFSERSAGFVWFFSFLVKFAQVKDEKNPVILLLDEPGLTLHGKAQADLLRFFKEKLAPHHQIIYSTHSPFMVPADDLMSVRIVEDQVEQKGPRRVPMGTKVREDVLTRDPDTLFPLQGALGYEITQSLFVGKNTLLVEGPSDILYLKALSQELRRRARTVLDERWTLCPSGGIDKIRPFVSLFSGNRLNIAVLSDQGPGDKKKIEDLRRSEILKAGAFFTIADFISQSDADVEDIFGRVLFSNILNNAYALTGDDALTPEKLVDSDKTTNRVVKQAEAAFRLMPNVPMIDHFTPAAWLIENPSFLDSADQPVLDALDTAEAIFSAFNKLL